MSTNTEGAKLITYTHSMQYDILYKTIRYWLGQSMQVMLHKIRPEWPAEFLLEQRGLYLCIPCFLENTSYHPSHSPSILPLTQWSSHVTRSCKCLALSCPGYHPISVRIIPRKKVRTSIGDSGMVIIGREGPRSITVFLYLEYWYL